MRRLIIGISGGSGAIYGIRTLEALTAVPDVETHQVMSGSARSTIADETDWKPSAVEALADVVSGSAQLALRQSPGYRPR